MWLKLTDGWNGYSMTVNMDQIAMYSDNGEENRKTRLIPVNWDGLEDSVFEVAETPEQIDALLNARGQCE